MWENRRKGHKKKRWVGCDCCHIWYLGECAEGSDEAVCLDTHTPYTYPYTYTYTTKSGEWEEFATWQQKIRHGRDRTYIQQTTNQSIRYHNTSNITFHYTTQCSQSRPSHLFRYTDTSHIRSTKTNCTTASSHMNTFANNNRHNLRRTYTNEWTLISHKHVTVHRHNRCEIWKQPPRKGIQIWKTKKRFLVW